MRTLCLDLKSQKYETIVDSYMAFSNRLKFRSPGFLFADITDTLKDFKDENHFLKELKLFNKDFFPKAKAAIASNPIHAQVFTQHQESYFACRPENEVDVLQQLPLSHLHHLEGLVAWSSQQEVEDIITFFRVLGFHTIGDLKRFELHSFQQRWGKTGELMWKRLHGYEKQIITPLKSDFNFVDHVDLQLPISLKPYLLLQLENHIRLLINNAKSENKEVNKLMIYLHCEYNYDIHVIEVSSKYNFLNLVYIYEELDRKLSGIDFSNPIRKFDIEAFTCKAQNSKFKSWTQQQERNRLSSKQHIDRGQAVLSGFLPSQIAFEDTDTEQMYELDHSLDKISLNGRSLTLAFNKCDQPGLFEFDGNADNFEEISHIEKYAKLSPIESSLLNIDVKAWDRGQHFYLAIDENNEKVCICFDQIEQKYFKVLSVS